MRPNMNEFVPLCVGYPHDFRRLRDFIYLQSFADRIQVVGQKDSVMTGNFEVTIGDRLIHSKKRHGTNCDGTTDTELAMIGELIQEYLDNIDQKSGES
jgi:selT/selW/selH-like putative selenoprotein